MTISLEQSRKALTDLQNDGVTYLIQRIERTLPGVITEIEAATVGAASQLQTSGFNLPLGEREERMHRLFGAMRTELDPRHRYLVNDFNEAVGAVLMESKTRMEAVCSSMARTGGAEWEPA